MSSALRHAIKRALAVKNDKGVVEQARTGFYERTDDAFHVLLAAAVLDAGAQPRREAARHWLTAMRRAALEVFNTTYPLPLEDAETAIRVVKARGALDGCAPRLGKRTAQSLA